MPTNPLRRSCHLCRNRKIKCSGEPICSACRERGLDCIYDVESGKGRPPKGQKRGSAGNERSSTGTVEKSQGGGLHAGRKLSSSNAATTAPPVNASDRSQDGQATQHRLFADDLSQMFDEDFISLNSNTQNIFQNIIADFGQRMKENVNEVIEASGCTALEISHRDALSYEGLLPYMRAEMIEMIAVRFGSLGCQLRDAGDRRFYLAGLLADRTETMFGEPYEGTSPLDSFDSYRILQFVDTWFSIHPLSSILSKTLLLRSLKSNTVDEALLAMILADACSAFGTSELSGSPELEQNLVAFATTQLSRRQAGRWTIASTQALVLVGWREMCMKNTRRATCWLGYAGRGVTELYTRSKSGQTANQQRINGVELSAVEDETIRCIYWVVFSTTFWALMQIDAPFSMVLPKSLPFDFPPINESSSAAISLDIASDNISTLFVQSRTLRELWPLSQIASTTTHICALDPGRTDADEGPHGIAWQSRHLHKLRRLLTSSSDISPICSNVCFILQEAINGVKREVYDGFLQAMILCTYRTLIIHLLFPRAAPSSEPIHITQSLVQDLSLCMEDVLSLPRSISGSQMNLWLFPRDNSRTRTIADTLALGLDACGRALAYLHARAFAGSKSEYSAVAERGDEFTNFATRLHQVAKESFLWDASFIRPIKRRLKEVKLAYSSFGQVSDKMCIAGSYAPSVPSSPKQSSGHISGGSVNLPESSIPTPSLEMSTSAGETMDLTSLPVSTTAFSSGIPTFSTDNSQLDYFNANMMSADLNPSLSGNLAPGNIMPGAMALPGDTFYMPDVTMSTTMPVKQPSKTQSSFPGGRLIRAHTPSQQLFQAFGGEEMSFW